MIRTKIMLLLLSTLMVAGCAVKKPVRQDRVSTAVTVEKGDVPGRQFNVVTEHSWERKRFSAIYDREIMPVFPEEAVEARIPGATVRVDFRIGTDGLAKNLDATAEEDVPLPELFEKACVEAVAKWQFSPAWQLAGAGGDPAFPFILTETRAGLIFHFDLEIHRSGGDVGISFEQE